MTGDISPTVLRGIEETAIELARLAGAEIVSALGGLMSVTYKEGLSVGAWRDPVSEVDRRVEALIRTRLGERFPNHGVIGEEYEDRPAADSAFIWAIDPIDGTTNFINGFPMFAATIGVLHNGRPVAGATWCATSHALRAGVYHAAAGGPLCLDGQPVMRTLNPDVRRGLYGSPGGPSPLDRLDARKTGSAAIECAFAAAGLLQLVRFDAVNLWDIAAGAVLIQSAGGLIMTHDGEVWRDFETFAADGDYDALRTWRRPMIAGAPGMVAALTAA